MRGDNIVGWCSYCKEAIYSDEPYVIVGYNIYHAKETNEHDNCFSLISEGETEE